MLHLACARRPRDNLCVPASTPHRPDLLAALRLLGRDTGGGRGHNTDLLPLTSPANSSADQRHCAPRLTAMSRSHIFLS